MATFKIKNSKGEWGTLPLLGGYKVVIDAQNEPSVQEDSMNVQELLEELEGLRIGESSYFDVSECKREAYDRANEMLDDCIAVVKSYQ